MSKLESILFNVDEGPASSLLRQGNLTINTNENNGHTTGDNNLRETKTAAAAAVATRSTALSSLVGSDISPSGALSPQSVLSDDHSVSISQQLQQQQLQSNNTIRKLREQIQTLQNEVTEERKQRRRKEKSILKLAKELTTRSVSEHRSHQKIEELQETMQDLENRLLDRNRTIQVTLPQLEMQNQQLHESINSYQKEIQVLQQQQQMMKSRERSIQKSSQMLLLMQQQSPVSPNPKTSTTLTAVSNESISQIYSPSLLGELSERSATTTLTDRTTIEPRRSGNGHSREIPSTNVRRTSTEMTNAATTTKEDKRTKTMVNIPVVWLLFSLMIIVIVITIGNDSIPWTSHQPFHEMLLLSTPNVDRTHMWTNHRIQDIVMDGICAPIRPGRVWISGNSASGNVIEYEAPWWIPSSLPTTYNMKEYVFNLICSSRQRTRIEINHNSISIYECTDTNATAHNYKNGKATKPILNWKLVGDGNVLTASSNRITIVRSLYQPKKWNSLTNNVDSKNSITTAATGTRHVTIEHVKAPWSSIGNQQ